MQRKIGCVVFGADRVWDRRVVKKRIFSEVDFRSELLHLPGVFYHFMDLGTGKKGGEGGEKEKGSRWVAVLRVFFYFIYYE